MTEEVEGVVEKGERPGRSIPRKILDGSARLTGKILSKTFGLAAKLAWGDRGWKGRLVTAFIATSPVPYYAGKWAWEMIPIDRAEVRVYPSKKVDSGSHTGNLLARLLCSPYQVELAQTNWNGKFGSSLSALTKQGDSDQRIDNTLEAAIPDPAMQKIYEAALEDPASPALLVTYNKYADVMNDIFPPGFCRRNTVREITSIKILRENSPGIPEGVPDNKKHHGEERGKSPEPYAPK